MRHPFCYALFYFWEKIGNYEDFMNKKRKNIRQEYWDEFYLSNLPLLFRSVKIYLNNAK